MPERSGRSKGAPERGPPQGRLNSITGRFGADRQALTKRYISFPTDEKPFFHHKGLAIKAALHPFRVLMKTGDDIWSRYRVKMSTPLEIVFRGTTLRDKNSKNS
ncbi:hypothetical protein PYR71_17950 [Rhizobium sp. MC63]|uniref:Uncharacterized protein n=1 Tax=Rhizobium mulingense TaxID=3031128 RepID=A0ACC6MZN8_9HYPH|nr:MULTISPECIES: hypothetical protein [unclassified Rhizobium]MDF0698354.1 hypothetical protein [Rhizobium sp. MC63]MEA3518796.1 hypothetical protein [Rhizobium sp. MJ31]MEB3045084.1 hypothetical protein [Rhizobium sp. MJ21]